jgi:peptidoglycan/xylan/chitin deacetylase (PgdA/CDA1 family)
MPDVKKEAFGAIAVTIVAVVLFVLSMASMVRVGQSTGQKIRGKASHGIGVPGALDSTTGAAATWRDTTLTSAGDTSSVLPRGSVATVSSNSGASDAEPPARAAVSSPASGVPVLCYHYLRGSGGPIRFFKVFLYVVLSLPVLDDNEVWTQTQSAFEKQMRYLHENGYQTITLDDFDEWQHGRKSLPPKPVVITFDDGDRSVYDYAWPILEKYGFNAAYFIITKQVDREWEGLDFLTWDQLRELHESRVFTIESHTHDLHYKIGDKYSPSPVFLAASDGRHSFPDYDRWEDKVLDDLERSRELIATNVGRAPHHLAWPYGGSNEVVDDLALRAGFSRTYLLKEGMNESFAHSDDTLSPLERVPVRRFAISARTSLRTFKKILAGEYEPSDRY